MMMLMIGEINMKKTVEIGVRDPFVLVDDNRYYLYGTRGEMAFTNKPSGLDVYVSDDMENWSEAREVFPCGQKTWGDHYFWAPEVYHYQEKYYMFTTFARGKKELGTLSLIADSPLGPFREWSDGPLTPEKQRCLDGTLYVRDGIPFMVYCHEWKEVIDGQICYVRLSNDLKSRVSDPVVLFTASSAGSYVKPHFFRYYVTDGPFMITTEDGKMHMLWSSHGRKGYLQFISNSNTNELDGNWSLTDALFSNDGGHGMIFRSLSGEYYLVLHNPNTFKKEHPMFIKLEYTNGFFRKA